MNPKNVVATVRFRGFPEVESYGSGGTEGLAERIRDLIQTHPTLSFLVDEVEVEVVPTKLVVNPNPIADRLEPDGVLKKHFDDEVKRLVDRAILDETIEHFVSTAWVHDGYRPAMRLAAAILAERFDYPCPVDEVDVEKWNALDSKQRITFRSMIATFGHDWKNQFRKWWAVDHPWSKELVGIDVLDGNTCVHCGAGPADYPDGFSGVRTIEFCKGFHCFDCARSKHGLAYPGPSRTWR